MLELGAIIMDFSKKFSVAPGAKFTLADIDPAYKGKHESHQSAAPEATNRRAAHRTRKAPPSRC